MAAKIAVQKIGIVKKNDGKWKGKIMVVGATGSIGAVSAKVLSLTVGQVILVAPRGYKLLELKDEIENIDPTTKITIATSPEAELIGTCDLDYNHNKCSR